MGLVLSGRCRHAFGLSGWCVPFLVCLSIRVVAAIADSMALGPVLGRW